MTPVLFGKDLTLKGEAGQTGSRCVCVYICKYKNICIYIHICICICIYTNIQIYIFF